MFSRFFCFRSSCVALFSCQLRESFLHWGGIPRDAFQEFDDQQRVNWQSLVAEAGRTGDIQALCDLGLLKPNVNISQHIMHYDIDENFMRVGVRFGTSLVRDAVLKAVSQHAMGQVRTFVVASSHKTHDRVTSAIYGECFEYMVHQWFSMARKDQQLKCRRLGVWLPSDLSTVKDQLPMMDALGADSRSAKLHLTIPHFYRTDGSHLDSWTKTGQIKFHAQPAQSRMWTPMSTSEAAVDFVFIRGSRSRILRLQAPKPVRLMPSQVTVSLKHGFKAQAMANLLAALDSEAVGGAADGPSVAETYSTSHGETVPRHELFFFVPPEVFPYFRLQSALDIGKKVMVAKNYPKVLRNLVQWVVCMPFELLPR